MIPPLDVNLAKFGVSAHNGFLPDELPLERLSSIYYAGWEAIMERLPLLLKSRSLRTHVEKLPILSSSHLVSEREWQRGYSILSFMTHAYIWELGGPSERLPPTISVPFLEISSHLGLPPTATYAATNLWNFSSLSPDDLSCIENLKVLHTFTGTRDEEWFYLISVAIEARGAETIPLMLKAMDAVKVNNSHLILATLVKLAYCIQEIGVILKRMNECCSPDVFYNDIRPFLAGSKNMSVAGLPKGVFYDEGDGKGEWRQYSGGSNAQSSLIQFFDIVLGVEHTSTRGQKGSKNGFLQDMRNYMPGPHSSFLQHVESVANIREYVDQCPIPEVVEAYNMAVNELGRFRDIHIQIIARYIIRPSKKHVPTGNSGLNLAVASSDASTKSLQGTGGTELLPFLRQSRDETKNAVIE